MVVHSIVFPPKILALADVLATRMRELNGGRQWMGAHMRRGDCEYFRFPTLQAPITDHQTPRQSSGLVGQWNPLPRLTSTA
jgi:hypothetical protein